METIANIWFARPRIWNNPVILYELIKRLRNKTSFHQLFFFLMVTCACFAYSWFLYKMVYSNPAIMGMSYEPNMLFTLMSGMQSFALFLIVPLLTGSAVNLEYEQDTWTLLYSSPLSVFSILIGKLLSSTLFMWLLLICTLPFYGIFFMVGGVSPSDFVHAFVYMTETILMIGIIGIYCSSTRKRVISSIASTYFISFFFFFIFPTLRMTLSLRLGIPLWIDVYLYPGMYSRTSYNPNALFPTVQGPFSTVDPVIVHTVLISLLFLFISWLTARAITHRNPTVVEAEPKKQKPQKKEPSVQSERTEPVSDRYTFFSDRSNPVYQREWLDLSRINGRSLTASCTSLIVLSGVLIFFYGAWTEVDQLAERYSTSIPAWAMFILPLLVIPYAANCIRAEIDRDTWDLLKTTSLSSSTIIMGKLFAGLKAFALRFFSFFAIALLFILMILLSNPVTLPAYTALVTTSIVSAFATALFIQSIGINYSLSKNNTVSAYGFTMVISAIFIYILPYFLQMMRLTGTSSGALKGLASIISPLFFFATHDFIGDVRSVVPTSADAQWLFIWGTNVGWMLVFSSIMLTECIKRLNDSR